VNFWAALVRQRMPSDSLFGRDRHSWLLQEGKVATVADQPIEMVIAPVLELGNPQRLGDPRAKLGIHLQSIVDSFLRECVQEGLVPKASTFKFFCEGFGFD